MSRRGENIYKRKDGRWEGRYIERYEANGKAKYKSVYARTYSDVRIKMKDHAKAETAKKINISVADWVEQYLQTQEIKLSTMKIYERHLKKYIKPFFQNISLRKLNKEILQAFVNSLSDKAPSTVKGIFSFLRKTLKTAGKKGFISPIWIDIELPKGKHHQIEVFTKDEQQAIEQSLNIYEKTNEIGILICLYTGLRIGELCGLKWDDIDFVSKTMVINRTIQRITIDGKSVVKAFEPKSESSHRKIPIPSFLIGELKKIKDVSNTPYILQTKGHMMEPRTFQYQYKQILERAGVQYRNPHILRHTFSVRALEVGFDFKTLSEILGHSNAVITMKTYAHSLYEHKKNSMERLGAIRS